MLVKDLNQRVATSEDFCHGNLSSRQLLSQGDDVGVDFNDTIRFSGDLLFEVYPLDALVIEQPQHFLTDLVSFNHLDPDLLTDVGSDTGFQLHEVAELFVCENMVRRFGIFELLITSNSFLLHLDTVDQLLDGSVVNFFGTDNTLHQRNQLLLGQYARVETVLTLFLHSLFSLVTDEYT